MCNPNDSAFPQDFSVGSLSVEVGRTMRGLTKREYFAALMLQGLLTKGHGGTATGNASIAVYWADALIAELAKTEGEHSHV
jgi:hypothetical protein